MLKFSSLNFVMTTFFMKNSCHEFDLVNISHDSDTLIIRLFKQYKGNTNIQYYVKNIEDSSILDDVKLYNNDELYIKDQNDVYVQKWTINLSFDENELQLGGNYAVVQCDNICKVIRVDSEKFPDIKISNKKWFKLNGYKPILEFLVTNKDFNQVDWLVYHNINDQIKILIKGSVDNRIYDRGSFNLIPFVSFIEGPFGMTKIVCPINKNINGPVLLVDRIGNLVWKESEFVNGIANINTYGINDKYSFNILYGYNLMYENYSNCSRVYS